MLFLFSVALSAMPQPYDSLFYQSIGFEHPIQSDDLLISQSLFRCCLDCRNSPLTIR